MLKLSELYVHTFRLDIAVQPAFLREVEQHPSEGFELVATHPHPQRSRRTSMRKPSCLISCSQPAPAGGLSAGLGKQGSQKSGKVTHRYLGRCRGEHRRARRWCGRLRGGRGDLPGSRGALASGAHHPATGADLLAMSPPFNGTQNPRLGPALSAIAIWKWEMCA